MPIIVDPTIPPPTPPETVTSPDGLLTAYLDPAHAGTLLVADLSSSAYPALANPDFEIDAAGWFAYQYDGTTTLTRETVAPLAGTGSLRAAWSAGSGSSGTYMILPEDLPVGADVEITFTVAFPDVVPTTLHLVLSEQNAAFHTVTMTLDPATTTAQTLTVRTRVDQVAKRVYLYVKGNLASTGYFLLDDVSVSLPVRQVRFVRTNPDGTEARVRSGDPAWAPGGIAVAYDAEATLGEGVAWYAVPLAGSAALTPTDLVGALLPAGTLPRDVWLKSVEDPALSRRFQVSSWGQLDSTVETSVTRIPGRREPHVTYDVRTSPDSTMVVETETVEEYNAMRALLEAGPLLVQVPPEYQRPDAYVLVTDVTETMTGLAYNPGRRWELTLTEIGSPPTTGSALRVPGRSYDDRLTNYPTYDDIPARTYLEALTG